MELKKALVLAALLCAGMAVASCAENPPANTPPAHHHHHHGDQSQPGDAASTPAPGN